MLLFRQALRRRQPPDITVVALHWPAFAVIVGIPNVAPVLTKYVMDTQNPLDYRIAVFHVLRYIDTDAFKRVADSLDKELAESAPSTRKILKAIENGGREFEGIYPVSDASELPQH